MAVQTLAAERHTVICPLDFAEARPDWPPVVLVSNRGPVEHDFAGERLVSRRGCGGLIASLSPIVEHAMGCWVSAARSEADRFVAGDDHAETAHGRPMAHRMVVLDPEVSRRHYLRFSNPLLWFLHHGLLNHLAEPVRAEAALEDWGMGYVPANRSFAAAALAEARALATSTGRVPVVSVHDYQLYLVPGFVRSALPKVLLQQFVHVPWPAPSAWRHLPKSIVQSICESLLACDVVGFQSREPGMRFIETCLDVLPGVSASATDEIRWKGRTTRVRSYPISVDVESLKRQVQQLNCVEYRRLLLDDWTGQTIVRVDRMDPSRNILAGLRAFDRLLRRRRDLHGQVRLLAFLVPSRMAIAEYRTYSEAVLAAADSINDWFGSTAWKPVQVFYEDNYLQALAGMSIADVLFLNPVADGTSLVAKEGVVVNECDAALILSKNSGTYAELGPAAIGVQPHNVDATAAALEQALGMSAGERRLRAAWLRSQVERNDAKRWVERQFADLLSDRGAINSGASISLELHG